MTTWSLIESDALDALRAMPSNSVDACLTDPPYGLGNREPTVEELVAYLTGADLDMGGDFMGKQWKIPPVAVWRELLRVLKPGAIVLSFSGTRTQDLISIGMRAAGFEVRDAIDWVYANGFPKSLDIERAISCSLCTLPGRHYATKLPKEDKRKEDDHICPVHPRAEPYAGEGTALKPAREPVIVARKPLDGTYVDNVLAHGVGGIDIDGCRIAGPTNSHSHWSGDDGSDATSRLGFGDDAGFDSGGTRSPAGRWPANLVMAHDERCECIGTQKIATGTAHRTNGGGRNFGSDDEKPPMDDLGYAGPDGKEEIDDWECVEGCPVRMLDEQSGDRPGMSGGGVHRADYGGGMFGGIDSKHTARGDHGGVSRFFYCTKASKAEREFGCEHLPEREWWDDDAPPNTRPDQENTSSKTGERQARKSRNFGPCVKPIGLTKHLAKLPLPPPRPAGPPRRLLVLYAGTASEMIGAMRAGWDEIVGIQRTSDDEERAYVAIARARLTRWSQVRLDMDEAEACGAGKEERKAVDRGQTSLFSDRAIEMLEAIGRRGEVA